MIIGRRDDVDAHRVRRPAKTSLADKLREVARTRDPRLAGRIVDVLRFQRGATYAQCQAKFAEYGIDADTFENLMQESDALESRT